MVVLGYESTLQVTMEDMIRHTQAVVRATDTPFIVADMPFLSYQVSVPDAVLNAGRLVQQGGAQAVKLEGGRAVCDRVHAITQMGVPVMGHLGLTPQSVHQLGGYGMQARTEAEADELLQAALQLEAAGAFAVVLESVPEEVGERVTRALHVPTIGIGAGGKTSGQVLVTHDMLGFNPRPAKFVRRFADLHTPLVEALRAYGDAVTDGTFPGEAEVRHAPFRRAGEQGAS
jgi:3-methyl-2-oxobutanoate hydroxymethyltransferase